MEGISRASLRGIALESLTGQIRGAALRQGETNEYKHMKS